MTNNWKDYHYCGVQSETSSGYIRITPLYGQQQLTDTNTVMPASSIAATYVEPIGRKELATTWWENCPNQCMAHFPSNKPCAKYCKPLRKHVSILSKKMITIKHITDGTAKWDNEDDSHISNGKSVNDHGTHTLIMHPGIVQKQQAKLIHITHIQQSNTRHAASEQKSCYNLRIGNDWARPWMNFHVSIVQPCPKMNLASYNIKPSTTTTGKLTPAKRRLEFHSDGYPRDHMLSFERVNKRYNDRNDSLYDETNLLQQKDDNHITEQSSVLKHTTNPGYDQWLNGNPQDVLLYRSEESEASITTDDKPVITTQQLISEKATAATPKVAPKQVPEVTPASTIHRNSCDTFNKESLSENISSQRQLFPVEKSIDTFILNKHCERIFQDEFIEQNEIRNNSRPSDAIEHCIDSQDKYACMDNKQCLSSQQGGCDGDSDEEQYATYLSLPLPEGSIPSSSHNDSELSVAQPIYNNLTKDDTIQTENPLRPFEDCPPKTKVVDLTYHDWKNMNTGQQPPELRMKSTSRFRQTMIELILLNNKEMDSDDTNRKKLWLPSLFNEDSTLSPSWKFDKIT